jgi:hypothetical protein
LSFFKHFYCSLISLGSCQFQPIYCRYPTVGKKTIKTPATLSRQWHILKLFLWQRSVKRDPDTFSKKKIEVA